MVKIRYKYLQLILPMPPCIVYGVKRERESYQIRCGDIQVDGESLSCFPLKENLRTTSGNQGGHKGLILHQFT